YVPTLGRFLGIDALADLMPTMSPMAYAYNNPILFYDPLGLSGIPGCKECPAGVVMEEVTITAPNMSTPDSFSMLNNLSWNSNPVYRNIGVQFDKGNFEYLNRAFNQPFIHYGEGLGGETEW